MSGTHSILSPSKAPMILRCVAALAAGKGAPNPPSEYSAEGTAYHEISAEVLSALALPGAEHGLNAGAHGLHCADYVGEVIEADGFKFTIDEENAAHAQTYVDAIRRLPGTQYFEVYLDTSAVVGVPGQGGTADAITMDYDTATIHVDDLKFGRGELVDAFDNEQLMTYGAAALEKYDYLWDWAFVKIAIHQPRKSHYSEQVWAVDKLREWVEKSRPQFQRAHELYQDPGLLRPEHFNPSEKACRWCPIKGSCAARTKKVLDMFPINASVASVTNLRTPPMILTDAALAEARDRAEEIEQWCADIKAEAHKRAIAGRAIPGWKLVQGRKGNRSWRNADFAEKNLKDALGDAAYQPRKIITVAAAEKVLKKNTEVWTAMQGNIEQAEGALSLERESVSKPAVDRPMTEFPLAEPIV